MNNICLKLFALCVLGCLFACDSIDCEQSNSLPPIEPDYIGVTIPINIAPLHFRIDTAASALRVRFTAGDCSFTLRCCSDEVRISACKWKKLLRTSQNVKVEVKAKISGKWTAFLPFEIFVAPEKIDSHLAYRLIEPGYELWNNMGIYQRNLENYRQKAIIENNLTDGGCMNCHSFCDRDPDNMLFHLRYGYAGTYIIKEGQIEKLNTKTQSTISALVYPYWHPSGNYVAFSVNDTRQFFHTTNANRVEVADHKSDVVVYDVVNHNIISCPQLMRKQSFETFPAFSPDGSVLYFCSADSVSIPHEYDKVFYSLCSIGFDAANGSFSSTVDTLFNARIAQQSVSFPRPSPDGRFLMFTLSSYGNFSIWHKDADLYMLDLSSREILDMEPLNSPDVESYHSWSSNSRWVVFSSRRIDKLYTRPYIAYIFADGRAAKPFLLPQRQSRYYDRLMKSFNIPEFVSGEMDFSKYRIAKSAKGKGIDISFGK